MEQEGPSDGVERWFPRQEAARQCPRTARCRCRGDSTLVRGGRWRCVRPHGHAPSLWDMAADVGTSACLRS